MSAGLRLLLVGATGLVGRHVLTQALADPRVAAVIAPVRRNVPGHRKLQSPQVDFDRLPDDAPWWHVDAVICTLGTTIRAAGSQAAFRRVDHDYPLDIARRVQAHGARAFALNSALGADAASRVFYNRVKGELERDLAAVGFDSLTFVRPGLIGGARDELRLGERVAGVVLGALGPLLPPRWRINPAPRIAAALLNAAVDASPGLHVVGSERLG
ncbi:NAD-dependent dehydratase [Luteimonas sp. TWI1437]|uniref:NAD-dependent dehydratase n=1 Tax=unclassified Luteimonas TaxID=2629088 RepID=UPI00320A79CD